LIVDPDPALAPVIPPVIGPTAQVKVLGILAVKPMFGPDPLHILAEFVVVTIGDGFTVTVIVYVGPVQVPVAAVGVTRYSTEPETVLLGLVNT